MPGGSIAIACDAPAGRTRLASVRYDGLSRVSRGFTLSDGGMRVVLSTLGPGAIGGDRYAVFGVLDERAALLVRGQMATPVFRSSAPSESQTHWHVAADAILCTIAEPLMIEAGGSHRATLDVDVAPSGTAIVADTIHLADGAHFVSRSRIRVDGTFVFYDALDVTRRDPEAPCFGMLAIVGLRGVSRAAIEQTLRDGAVAVNGVRCGIGATAAAIVVRVSGARVWDVACAIAALAERARVMIAG